MDEVTRLALELAWAEGFSAGYEERYREEKYLPGVVENPYSRKKDS